MSEWDNRDKMGKSSSDDIMTVAISVYNGVDVLPQSLLMTRFVKPVHLFYF